MRDYIVTLLVLASLPLILRKPFFGVLVWTLVSLMNPHRLCWGFATTFPFAQMVAITLMVALLISKEPKKIPWRPLTVILAVWWLWMLLTTSLALYPEAAWVYWDRVWKILLLTFLAIMMLNTRERVDALVWVIVLSLGLYGVKGGIFTVLSGGGFHVLGPKGTFIGGNTEIGLALVMTLPLMRYLQLASEQKVVKTGMLIAMLLTLVAILGTQSRGALLGLIAIAFYLVLKSRQKAPLILLMLLALPIGLMLMPESWHGRMETIQSYEEDTSAMSRINAWWTAWYLALDHPLTGGGFRVLIRPEIYAQYAPKLTTAFDAHSVYFQVLAEHGFVGLGIFLSLLAGVLRSLKGVTRFAKGHEQLIWMRDLSAMLYVSVIGYAVTGAFLGLAYFDYFYAIVALTIALASLKERYLEQGIPATVPAPEPIPKAPGMAKAIPGGARKSGLSFDFMGWYRRL